MPTIDLTHPLTEDASVYPGDPKIELRPHATHEEDGYRVTDLSLGSHSGTHIDAPSHTEPDGKTLDEFDVSAFEFDARLVDCRGKSAREAIRVEDLPEDLPADADTATDTDLLVFHTDWSDHWTTEKYLDHPYLAPETARWCAEQNLSVGLDALNPDPTPTENASEEEPTGVPAHRALLGSNCLVVENLTNLDRLPERFEVRAYPLALAGASADGAPVRAVAEW